MKINRVLRKYVNIIIIDNKIRNIYSILLIAKMIIILSCIIIPIIFDPIILIITTFPILILFFSFFIDAYILDKKIRNPEHIDFVPYDYLIRYKSIKKDNEIGIYNIKNKKIIVINNIVKIQEIPWYLFSKFWKDDIVEVRCSADDDHFNLIYYQGDIKEKKILICLDNK